MKMKFDWKAFGSTIFWLLAFMAGISAVISLCAFITLMLGIGWGLGSVVVFIILGFGILSGFVEGGWK